MTLETLLLFLFYAMFLNTVSSRNFRHYYQLVTTSLDLRKDLVALLLYIIVALLLITMLVMVTL